MEKYKETIELAEQVTKYLRGILSSEQEGELFRRLEAITDGQRILEQIRDKKAIASKRELYASFDAVKSWTQIERNLSRDVRRSRSLYRVIWYAAILVLPLAVAASVWFVRDSFLNEEKSQYIVDAYFEPHKTMLELSSGQRIALDTVTNIMAQLNQYGVTVTGKERLDYSGTCADSSRPVEYHSVVVPRGGEYNLKLADGTNVWLFAESEIRFPVHFEGKRREVFLSGEAFFEVHHDSSCPFYVKTKSLDVKVLGTSFNVKAYEDVNTVEASLVEGQVSVQDYVLQPNTQAVFNKLSGEISFKKIDGDNYRLRKERVFVFNEERLEDILREMARWYDFKVFFQNAEMADKKFGFKLEKYENVDSLFRLLELTGEVRFVMKGKTLIVTSTMGS